MPLDYQCPKCGAGYARHGTALEVQVPDGWPFAPPCENCFERGQEKFTELGRRAAEQLESEVLETLETDDAA